MIKIVPYTNRKLSIKNCRKIWNLFPYGEICITEIQDSYAGHNWTEKVARYFISRNRGVSIEIRDPLINIDFIYDLILIGVKKFYFCWEGVTNVQFLSAFDLFIYIDKLQEEFQDLDITIIYSPPMPESGYTKEEYLETSIICMLNFINKKDNVKLIYRRPHPFGGNIRLDIVKNIEKFIIQNDKDGKCGLESPCGCITIVPNTNIYCCPFCKRKCRKDKFGNALRDKFVIGTISRGIVREIDCDYCYLNTRNINLKEDPIKRIKYRSIE